MANTIKMPAKMRLINMLLKQNAKVTLKRFILRARTETATHPAETWDKIAHDIWNITGEPLVRETVINYARAFGMRAHPPITEVEAREVPPDEDEPGESQAIV